MEEIGWMDDGWKDEWMDGQMDKQWAVPFLLK